MAAFVIVLVSVLLITELNFINTVPVPELSVKLLCELLCEHCNGVSNMESGHCNCEVPETHFKDNSACLERVQISAAEMNLKLTHFKNSRRERSVNNILGRSKSEDAQIDYHSRGFNKISGETLIITPPTPNPLHVDQSEYQTPEHMEVFVKRSINAVSAPEQDLEQSKESEVFGKRYINYFRRSSLEQTMNRNKSIFGSPELTVELLYPQREKKSSIKSEETANNEEAIVLHKEIKTPHGNYDVSVRVQADFEIPASGFNPVDDDDDDSPSKDSRVHNKSTMRSKLDDAKSFVSVTPTDETQVPNCILSNKFRSNEVHQKIPKTGARVASIPTDLIDERKSVETIPGLPSPITLKLPGLLTPCQLREASEKQRNKLNELKLRLAKLLPIEPPKIPFPSYGLPLPRNDLLPGSRSSISAPENNPLAKLLSPCPPASVPRNRVSDDLPTNPVNDFELKRPADGMTLLEKIKNYQLKLTQDLLVAKPVQYRIPSTGQIIECQYANEPNVLAPKLNPLIPIPDILAKARESTAIECNDESNDVNSSSGNKFRSKSPKTEELRVDTPLTVPVSNAVSQEINRSHKSIPNILANARESTAMECNDESNDVNSSSGNKLRSKSPKTEEFKVDTPLIVPVSNAVSQEINRSHKSIDDVLISKQLPNTTDNVGLAKNVNKTDEKTSVSKPTSEHETNSSTPSSRLEVATRTAVNPPESPTPDTNHTNPVDSNENQHPEKSQQVLETATEKLPLVLNTTEAEGVPSVTPIPEPQRIPTEKPYTQALSNDPHFVNNQENIVPTYFSPAYMVPAHGNNIHLAPEETYYNAMVDPALFHNDMHRINYRPEEYPNPERESVLNRPVVLVPNSGMPFDHPGRLMPNFNRAPDQHFYSPPNEQGAMLMGAFVPANNNNPLHPSPSNLFILQPVRTPNGNIPYPELVNKIRSGHAIIQIRPTDPKDIDM